MDYTIKGFIIGDRDIKEFIADIDAYSDLVKKILWDEICLKFDGLDEELMEIKSPIEQAFYLTMKPNIGWLENRYGVHAVNFIPQCSIKIKNKTYRVDFLLNILMNDESLINFVVECDGHDFHEKTKKQAASDRQRERALTAAGYTVIRFTGSEIFNDPYRCAEEVYSIATTSINKKTGR